MAHAFKTRITPDGNGWILLDGVTGEERATIALPTDGTDQYKQCALYGLKQIVADGGAKSAGTSAAARLRGMLTRYNELLAGTYNFRDGTGSTGGLPDGDVYRALVALGVATDTDERRAMWKKIGAPARLALRQRSDVTEWLANNIATPDADDALDAWMNT